MCAAMRTADIILIKCKTNYMCCIGIERTIPTYIHILSKVCVMGLAFM